METKLAERLKKIRESLSLSQREFAEELGGIPPTTVSKYEQGLIKPSADMFSKLGYIGINLNWLLSGKGEMFLPEAQGRPLLGDPTGEPDEAVTRRHEAMRLMALDGTGCATEAALLMGGLPEEERALAAEILAAVAEVPAARRGEVLSLVREKALLAALMERESGADR